MSKMSRLVNKGKAMLVSKQATQFGTKKERMMEGKIKRLNQITRWNFIGLSYPKWKLRLRLATDCLHYCAWTATEREVDLKRSTRNTAGESAHFRPGASR
jgi:hypothetical protein